MLLRGENDSKQSDEFQARGFNSLADNMINLLQPTSNVELFNVLNLIPLNKNMKRPTNESIKADKSNLGGTLNINFEWPTLTLE